MTTFGGRQGPTKDPVLRDVFERDLAASVDWVLSTIGDPPVPAAAIRPVPTRLPFIRSTREADLLTWLGPDHLLQIEYESAPRADLWPRLLEYRHLIMSTHPRASLTQAVLILSDSPVINRDDHRPGRFRLGASIIRMADQDPDTLLASPGLEPLAILTDPPELDAETIYRRAFSAIRSRNDQDEHKSLIALMTLALGRLPVPTIERLQEESMFTLDELRQQMYDAPMTGRLMREAEEHGREAGRDQEREQVLIDMLATKFGQHEQLPAIVKALASKPRAEAIRAVFAAETIDDLPTA